MSKISISNLALANIAKESIQSLTEGTPEARACNQFFDIVLRIMLQAYPWRFARKSLSLAQISNSKAGKWSYAYQLPTDCLKILNIRPQYVSGVDAQSDADEVMTPYDIEGNVLFCNLSPAFLVYTTSNVNLDTLPPLFEDALAWNLSARISMPLTRDPQIRADCMKVAGLTTSQAQVQDANNVRNTSDIDSEYVTVRE